MSIEVRTIEKHYGDFTALGGVSLKVEKGELVALLGPSGSGKTTLLRIIAGLDIPDRGEVLLDGQSASGTHAKERRVGFVFQHYALFKHMTVFENVAFGLRVRPAAIRPTDEEIKRKVMHLLEMVHLEKFHNRYPAQLSGGQRQRVALARALAVEPQVLLLDEPFGALDAKVRLELRRWMRRLHDEIHITSVFVTHDQEEAMEVADRVVVMSNGRIEQTGTPEEVYHKPKNAFVYDFLGNYNEFDGWMDANGTVMLDEYDVVQEPATAASPANKTNPGLLERYPEVSKFLRFLKPVPRPQEVIKPARRVTVRHGEGKPVRVFARPHEMYIAREPEDGLQFIGVQVAHVNPAGSLVKLELERANGTLLQAEVPREVIEKLGVKRHDSILVRPKNFRVFDKA